jgi:hypothetical protein
MQEPKIIILQETMRSTLISNLQSMLERIEGTDSTTLIGLHYSTCYTADYHVSYSVMIHYTKTT